MLTYYKTLQHFKHHLIQCGLFSSKWFSQWPLLIRKQQGEKSCHLLCSWLLAGAVDRKTMMVQLLMLMFKFTGLVMSTCRNNYCNIKKIYELHCTALLCFHSPLCTEWAIYTTIMLNIFHTQTKIIFPLNLDHHLKTWINESLRTHHIHWFPPLSALTSTKFLAIISQTHCSMTPLRVQDIFNRFIFCFNCTAIDLEI